MEETRFQNTGIRIAGTLLAYFRQRRRLSQRLFAEKIHVNLDILRKFERGNWSSDFVLKHLVRISDELDLTGRELTLLQSATEADDFLRDIRITRPTEEEYQYRARAFESLLMQPDSGKRGWLRIVFDTNGLGDELQAVGAATDGARHSAKLSKILDGDLVNSDVLREIRGILRITCCSALDKGMPLDKISQILLYWARSVMSLKASHQEHMLAVDTIEAVLRELPDGTDWVVQRVLAHAMCELKHVDVMCHYLSRTHGVEEDAKQNLRFLVRRSADTNDGIKAMECLLNFLDSDIRRSSGAMCALDLRTATQLLAAYRSSDGKASTALESLQLTIRLATYATMFVASGPTLTWLRHRCAMKQKSETCQAAADRSAHAILDEIAAFSKALPSFAERFKGIIRTARPDLCSAKTG